MAENRKVALAGLLLSAVAILCRGASLAKETYVGYFFGPGAVVDAYALAILIPSFGMALFLNAVRRAYITQYPAFTHGDAPDGETYTNLFLTSLVLTSVAVALLLTLFLRPVVLPLLPADGGEVLSNLRGIVVPAIWLIVPMALIVGLTAALNARQEFSRPQFTHLLPPVAIAAFVFYFGRKWGPGALMWGLLAGSAVQSLALLWLVSRAGHRIRLCLRGHSKALRTLWALSVPIIFLELLVQGNTIVDRSMATMLEPGRLSILYWSVTLKDVISGTLVASLLIVLLPHFAGQVAEGSTKELRRSCSLVIRYAALFLLPISGILIICGPSALQHVKVGKLDQQTMSSVAWCLAVYGVGLCGELAGASMAQALLALRKIRALVTLGIFAFFIPNVVFNLLLIGPYGEVGLAMSTALVAWTTAVCNYFVLRRAIGRDDEKQTGRVLLGSLLAFALMVGAGLGISKAIHGLLPADGWWGLLEASIAGTGGLAVYGFLTLVFPGSSDARRGCRVLKEKLIGGRSGGART